MANKHRSNSRTKSMTLVPALAEHFALFGPPPLLVGEDAAQYDDLLGRMCAAVDPIDIIDELRVADVVWLQWEILRWRRVKVTLLQAGVHDELVWFLNQQLSYEAYAEAFAGDLAAVLQEIQNNLAEDQAKVLAWAYAESQPDAIEKVSLLLEAADLDPDRILKETKAQRAKELVQGYTRREPEAVKLVNALFESTGQTMQDLMLDALQQKLDAIEPIDRLITIAENSPQRQPA